MNRLLNLVAITTLAWAIMISPVLAVALPRVSPSPVGIQPPRYAHARALVTPQRLLFELRHEHPPIVVHVGPQSLYERGHVPGALHFQEVTTATGKAAFLGGLKRLPAARTIVLYCGCCSYDDCPFVQPAYEMAHAIYGDRIKLLVIPNSFEEDWMAKGYPIRKN